MKKYKMKGIMIGVVLLTLCGCASTVRWQDSNPKVRYLEAVIGMDGVSQETVQNLVNRFNEEALNETGIQLAPTYLPFNMKRQHEVWPLCENGMRCWADYTTIYYKWKGRGIAIYIREATGWDIIQRVGFGGVKGETDNTFRQYIGLYTTDYDTFKHEIYHVFVGHSVLGGMFAVRDVMGIPITTTSLSDNSKREIIKNKWRELIK